MALYGLNLANWWRIISRRKWIILFVFLAVFLSTIFFTNRQSPVYLAKVTVRVEEPKTIGEFILWGERGGGLDLAEEARLISEGAEEVAKRLGLVLNGATLKGLKEFRWISEKELSFMSGRVRIGQVGDSNIVEFRATAPTAEGAAGLANTSAQVYIELHLKDRIRRARALRQSIEKQLITFKTKLDESEQALKEFKEREGDIALEKKRLKDRLATLELELSEQMLRYPGESPVVKELGGQLEATRDQLKVLASKELELERLTRTLEYVQRRYEDYRERAAGARITEEDEEPGVSIVDPATPPKSPIRPNKLLNGFVGAVVGLMIGVSFTFLMENLRMSLRTIEEVESLTGLPVLGVIPYLTIEEEKGKLWRWSHYRRRRDRKSRLREQLIIHYTPQSPMAESYRSLRTSIQSAALEKGAKALLVTSAGPGEGKSITAANLAIAVAQAGYKVLLVGGDLRRPILFKLFGLKREPGLADCLTGTTKWENALRTIVDILLKTTEWEEILRTPGLDNLKIIPCGHLVLNPAELLGSEATKPFLEELKANFDLILFDSPPVLPIADAAILGPRLDGVILIYQTGRVARGAFRRAKEQLESVGAKVMGIVLNNTTREVEAYPPYAYYRYKYYGRKEEGERPEVTQ